MELVKYDKNDPPCIYWLKKRFRGYIDEKFKIPPYHLIATFLTPIHRPFDFPNKELVDIAEDKLLELLEEELESEPGMEENEPGPCNTTIGKDYMFA